MKRLPFNPRRVPYRYLTELGGVEYIVEWGWNPVGEFFTFSLYDPDSGEMLWHRPMRYGVNLLWGCTLRGLEGKALVPLDDGLTQMPVGITLGNADTIKVWLVEV